MTMFMGVMEGDNQEPLNYRNGVFNGIVIAACFVVFFGMIGIAGANGTYYPPSS